jgi:hypothetical protein
MLDYKNITWDTWKHYFVTGKTIPIYTIFMAFAISVLILFLHYGDIVHTFGFYIASVSAYAVFTDLVAHLFTGKEDPDMPLQEFIKRIFRIQLVKKKIVITMRTHDIYGLIISMTAMLIFNHVIGLLVAGLEGITLYYIFKAKFYH